MATEIKTGDCTSVLKTLDANTFNTCVTSPPYWGLRDYGEDAQLGLEQTPEEYVANMVKVFREVKRVLRDDGTLWLNLGDSYSGSGKGPSSSLNKKHHHMEHAHSSVVPLGLKPKDLVGIPWRVAFALQADGWYLRQDIIWHKPNPMPESVRDRCTKAHEYIFLLSKRPKYFFDNEVIKEDCVGKDERKWADSYEKAGSIKQGETNANIKRTKRYSKDDSFKRNKRSVWTVTTKPFKGAHFATFRMDLIEPCVLAGCPVGGTVLDPFAGSGTTGIVAASNDRDAILLELNEDYIKLALDRMKSKLGVFGNIKYNDCGNK